MEKLKNFLKTNQLVIVWTIEYVFILWFLFEFLFNFNMFSIHHWIKFFNTTLHGFYGFVFAAMVYTSLPLYVASTLIIYRKKKPVVDLQVPEKIKKIPENIAKNIIDSFVQTNEPVSNESAEEKTESTPQPAQKNDSQYPDTLPPELYVPYLRAKNNMGLTDTLSDFNKQPENETISPTESTETPSESFPIPSDFDISDSLSTEQPQKSESDDIPTFKDLDFDSPIITQEPETSEKSENAVIKYLNQNNIEYETYMDFIATEKYLIYDHNDSDFWIMDDDNWFASGKQKTSPIPEMLKLAKQNDLTPTIYFESENVMNIEETKQKIESAGVHILKNLDELK